MDQLNFPIDRIIDQFWPFLAVAAGVWLIFSHRNRRLTMTAIGLIAALGLGYAVVTPRSEDDNGSMMAFRGTGHSHNAANLPIGKLKEASLTCNTDFAALTLKENDDERFLLSSSGGIINDGNYQLNTSNIRLNVDPLNDGETTIELAKDVAWDIDCTAGAGSIEADLSQINVHSLSLGTDFGQALIELPATIENPVTIRGGAGNIELTIPDDIPVEIHVESAFTNIDVDESITNIDVDESITHIANGMYVNDKWQAGEKALEVNISLDFGELKLR